MKGTVDTGQSRLLETLERDLARVRDELDHAHRLSMIGTVTAGLAHELNNLLTPALGYAQLCLQRGPDAQPPHALERIVSAISSSTRILSAILDFSSTGDEGTPESDVADVLEAAVKCLGRDLARDGITLDRQVGRSTVRMTPICLQQVLLNLLLNARKAMLDRGGDITVRCIDRPDDMTVITVADSGPGIPEAVRGTLFEPFVSHPIDASVYEERDGESKQVSTGLGLSICKRLVERSGGTIAVRETQGGGATFVVTLPAIRQQAAARAG